MPLRHDPEYGEELRKLRERVDRENSSSFKWFLITCPVLFIGLLFFYRSGLIDETATILLAIGLATFLLGLRLLEICNAVNGHLTIQTGAIEWIGRKQLGEYEAPTSAPVRE
jgi:hypothetical protein